MAALVLLLALNALPIATDAPSLPEDLEVELALSALPAHLRDAATVYVYDDTAGYRVVREGANGFHALVGRDDPAVRWAEFSLEDYSEDLLIPIAFDAAGVPAQLQTYLDLGRWRAEGVAASEAQRRLREGVESGHYPAPARPGVSYMLSPILRAYRDVRRGSEIGTFLAPHYMFYAPGVGPEDVGAGPDLRTLVLRPGTPDPHGMIVAVAGAAERQKYREEHAGMLARLCELHEPWCLGG